MNPLQWLLKLSSDLATARAGAGRSEVLSVDAPVDAREYEGWVDIDGSSLFVSNRKSPERWVQISADGSRLARVTEGKADHFQLMVYERRGASWEEWEGPSLVKTLDDAIALAQQLFARRSS